MSSMIVTGKLPASFIPVEYSFPPQRRTSSASSSSDTGSSRSTRTYDLVHLLEPSYRYLLRPGSALPQSALPTSPSVISPSGGANQQRQTTSDRVPTPHDDSEQRRVRRKGKAYRSPPLEPAHPQLSQSTDTDSVTTGSLGSNASSSGIAPLTGMVTEPLAYVGTINYGFILNACQMISHAHDGDRSPPRNGDHSSHRHSSSAKSSKGKSGGAKNSAGLWDWKGKGNTRSAKECPVKQKKGVTHTPRLVESPFRETGQLITLRAPRANNVRETSEEQRSRSKRPARTASQQRQTRNKSAEPAAPPKRTCETNTSVPLTRNNSSAGLASSANDAKQSSSLVPPSTSIHQAHLHPPPSPLRQSAIPARLVEKSLVDNGKANESGAMDASMARSSSHGGAASDAIIHATRGSKRRQSSAGPSFGAGEDEQDVSKRLRRALASSIPISDPSHLAPGSPKRPARASRTATRYATRSAPNSPPEATSDSFDSGAVDLTVPRSHPAVTRVGRGGLRRTLSHDALPEEQEGPGATPQSRTKRDVSLPKNLRDYETGIHV